jgi:archaellum component FlaF (FlaF/FlaG flagellin family)
MITATIGTTTYNVVTVDVKYSICKHNGCATLEIDHANLNAVTTFDPVTITANGIDMFTGFVESIDHGNFPYTLVLNAESAIIKAERTWFESEYISNGESVATWLGTFLSKSQITDTEISVDNIAVYAGHSWTCSTCLEAITNICQITNSRFYPTRTGKTVIKKLNTSGVADYTVVNYENLETLFSTGTTRNNAVVFGANGIHVSMSSTNPYLVAGETRTVTISSSLIQTYATAQRIAQELLLNFNDAMQLYTFTVEGQPQLSLNDYVTYGDVGGAITSLRHVYNDKKFVTEISIGEICPTFFGIDILPPEVYPYLYASAESNGVWKSDEVGTTWSNISGSLAGKTVPAIHYDGLYLWAITETDIYRGNGVGIWTKCVILSSFSLNNSIILKENLELKDIITDASGNIYVVAFESISKRITVLVSQNNYLFDRMLII